MATKPELEAEIAALKAQLAEKPVETTPEVKPEIEVKGEAPTMPIPRDYLDGVKTILNQKFTPKIEYSVDAPTFAFSVLVPREYSNATGAHWDMYHEDRRVRVLNNAAGPAGVKEWLKMVYDNLDAEVRARIVAEREV